MIRVSKDLSVTASIDGDESLYFIKIFISKGNSQYITLEFSEITNYINDLIDINNQMQIYESSNDILKDVAEGHLNKFLNEENNNPKINMLLNLRMKARHQMQQCTNDCILCNPDLGEDPFPNFYINLDNTEGEA